MKKLLKKTCVVTSEMLFWKVRIWFLVGKIVQGRFVYKLLVRSMEDSNPMRRLVVFRDLVLEQVKKTNHFSTTLNYLALNPSPCGAPALKWS